MTRVCPFSTRARGRLPGEFPLLASSLQPALRVPDSTARVRKCAPLRCHSTPESRQGALSCGPPQSWSSGRLEELEYCVCDRRSPELTLKAQIPGPLHASGTPKL